MDDEPDSSVESVAPVVVADMGFELRKLRFLFEVTQVLNRSLSLDESIGCVLRKMAEHMDMLRGTLTILNRETGEIEIDQAYGLSSEERSRGRYRLGEGVTGRVVESGKPAIVARISQEPLFLDRTRTRVRALAQARKEISFICVPIVLGRETIGALSADRLFAANLPLEEDLHLLTIVSSLVAQAVRLRREARERERLLGEENSRLQGALLDRMKPANIIGQSHAIAQVYRLIHQVAGAAVTVLIRGESGVGKELVAAAIHLNSPRKDGPFVKVNLAALPETMIESELFGHERGAFTGAVTARKGRLEAAVGGTLFLDEIGDLPPLTQVKLLRVIQERSFERLGSNTSIRVDVRLVAATNRDLDALIAQDLFRADLFYRLNVFPIFVPPLRERKTDIILLADYFVERAARRHGKSIRRISTPAIDMLTIYHWPGNVRELENAIERAVLLSTDGVIHSHHLPPSLQTAEASHTLPQGRLPAAMSTLERELIVDALKYTHGNMAAAARHLGISERLIGLRVRHHGISASRFAEPRSGHREHRGK
jgi:Nif-specific regulatory protein